MAFPFYSLMKPNAAYTLYCIYIYIDFYLHLCTRVIFGLLVQENNIVATYCIKVAALDTVNNNVNRKKIGKLSKF